MYYIEQENDELVKYEVELDREKLEELKTEIISNCAEIVHQCYESSIERYNKGNEKYIKNFRKTFVKIKEYNDFYTPDEEIYRFEYDEYQPTKLATIVTNLMNGDTSMIALLKNYQPDEKKDKVKPIMDELDKLHKEMYNADNMRIVRIADLTHSLVEDLKKAEEDRIRNLDRKSDLEYYQQVLECIKLKEISRIKLSLLDEVALFFEGIIGSYISDNVDEHNKNNKIIQLIKEC